MRIYLKKSNNVRKLIEGLETFSTKTVKICHKNNENISFPKKFLKSLQKSVKNYF